jgi:hypothetical protein
MRTDAGFMVKAMALDLKTLPPESSSRKTSGPGAILCAV